MEGRLQEKEPFRAEASTPEVLTSEPPLSGSTLYSLAASLLLNPAPSRSIYMFKFSPKEVTRAAAQVKIPSGGNEKINGGTTGLPSSNVSFFAGAATFRSCIETNGGCQRMIRARCGRSGACFRAEFAPQIRHLPIPGAPFEPSDRSSPEDMQYCPRGATPVPRHDSRIGRGAFSGQKSSPPSRTYRAFSFHPLYRVPSPFTRNSRRDPPWPVDFASEAVETPSVQLRAASDRRCDAQVSYPRTHSPTQAEPSRDDKLTAEPRRWAGIPERRGRRGRSGRSRERPSTSSGSSRRRWRTSPSR